MAQNLGEISRIVDANKVVNLIKADVDYNIIKDIEKMEKEDIEKAKRIAETIKRLMGKGLINKVKIKSSIDGTSVVIKGVINLVYSSMKEIDRILREHGVTDYDIIFNDEEENVTNPVIIMKFSL